MQDFFSDLTDEVLSTVATYSDRPVGDGIAPGDPDTFNSSDYPYSVVYSADTNFRLMSGPFTNSQGDKGIRYHIVYVGYTRQSCEMLADRVRAAMTYDNFKDFSGVRIQHVTVDEYGALDRTTEVRPAVFTIRDTFLFRTTEG